MRTRSASATAIRAGRTWSPARTPSWPSTRSAAVRRATRTRTRIGSTRSKRRRGSPTRSSPAAAASKSHGARGRAPARPLRAPLGGDAPDDVADPVERGEVDPFDLGMRSLAGRSEEHRGDAGTGDQRGDVLPGFRNLADGLDERMLGIRGQRIPARDEPQLGVPGDRAQLLFDLIDGLPWDRAPFTREHA